MFETIAVSKDGFVAHVELNRPKRVGLFDE